jgi:hypothetical protein
MCFLPICMATAPLLFIITAAGAVNAEPRAFNFQNAEFFDHDAQSLAARTFAAERLPAGITMRVAATRTRRADAYCHAPSKSDGVVACGYSMLAHPAGGDLGEDWWLVRLRPGSAGTLKSATFTRARIWMGD